ncbi:hypothetical protein K2Q08_02605 [Patescibacteria group bacterium]|nr:hypothetical protein [Patescibacteria group bacterium]
MKVLHCRMLAASQRVTRRKFMTRTLFLSFAICLVASASFAQAPKVNYEGMKKRCDTTTDPISCKSAVRRAEEASANYDTASQKRSGALAASKELNEINEDLKKRFPTVWDRRYFD